MVEVVIAARGGSTAKSRCGAAAGNQLLVEAMLMDMLDAVAIASVDAVHLVTPTPSLADLARERQIEVICQRAGGDLNDAFCLARSKIFERSPRAEIILLPGDLPLISPADIGLLTAAHAPERLVICPALADGGTGALMLSAAAPFDFRFGADSFRRHVLAARDAGLWPNVVWAPGLSFDLDRPTDAQALLAAGTASRTARLLTTLITEESAA